MHLQNTFKCCFVFCFNLKILGIYIYRREIHIKNFYFIKCYTIFTSEEYDKEICPFDSFTVLQLHVYSVLRMSTNQPENKCHIMYIRMRECKQEALFERKALKNSIAGSKHTLIQLQINNAGGEKDMQSLEFQT